MWSFMSLISPQIYIFTLDKFFSKRIQTMMTHPFHNYVPSMRLSTETCRRVVNTQLAVWSHSMARNGLFSLTVGLFSCLLFQILFTHYIKYWISLLQTFLQSKASIENDKQVQPDFMQNRDNSQGKSKIQSTWNVLLYYACFQCSSLVGKRLVRTTVHVT